MILWCDPSDGLLCNRLNRQKNKVKIGYLAPPVFECRFYKLQKAARLIWCLCLMVDLNNQFERINIEAYEGGIAA
jgi:hypothetical protein